MMMMSLNSKQAFSMPHGGSLHVEPKYSALHSASPGSSAPAAPSTSSPSSSSNAGGGGGSGGGGGGRSSSSSSSGSSGGSGGGSEAMRRACLPTPPPHQALEGELLEHLSPGLALGAMAGPDGAVRRIKLGVTQADVGSALANLKIPGIAAIAEKLDLKKNVVRVWFCNQRQKQKRMKYSAGI
ncbi:hypothetical protein E2I00_002666 [Balaenoptera physalus]|uniref:Homeobox domain-containing protein n=1 Tax=Balaenoptera physalus TaxID=9770 RepID=A0A6A1QEP1_BALPH|nr:hypothetical protein E2I00_002666 [Balaenoptera physalus]